ESRMIPFLENEFVFSDWVSSGLSIAIAFAKGLTMWQRANLQDARLDISVTEQGGTVAQDLENICRSLFSGLRVVRLRI
ncbi:hypothetical protein BGZ61DRAFT_319499, partial [Ilyonectria robusta]|uniref:uncharacterized protein n=1 Tax=Ilyonectria robusta TaxID=1079257 RepID=UPI001E8EBD10